MAGVLPHIFLSLSPVCPQVSPPPTPKPSPRSASQKGHHGHFSFVQVGIGPHAQIAAGAVESPGAVAVVVYPPLLSTEDQLRPANLKSSYHLEVTMYTIPGCMS